MSLIHVYEMIVSCRFDTKVWFPKYIEYWSSSKPTMALLNRASKTSKVYLVENSCIINSSETTLFGFCKL